jgi:hypothetical protein
VDARKPFRLEPFEGEGLQLGVNLADDAGLEDLMDQS